MPPPPRMVWCERDGGKAGREERHAIQFLESEEGRGLLGQSRRVLIKSERVEVGLIQILRGILKSTLLWNDRLLSVDGWGRGTDR